MGPPALRRRQTARHRVKSPWAIPVRLIAGFVVLLLVAAVGTALFLHKGTFNDSKDPSLVPIAAAEHYVRLRVGDGHVVDFGPPELTTVEQVGDPGRVKVSGIVQVVRDDGSSTTSYAFQCRLEVADGAWNLLQLDMMKQ